MEPFPTWLSDVAACPEDSGPLSPRAEGAECTSCGRRFPASAGILHLLPDRLSHLARPDAAAGAQEEDVRWIEDELRWWDPWWERESVEPLSRHAGLRGRSRERNLLRHVRGRLGDDPLVLEMGAGSSRTVAGLWPPASSPVRYVASDMSVPALRSGRSLLGPRAASVQCDAVNWPFREGAADVVMILGVLHHLSNWREALRRACATVRPGGFLLLHEAVTKPRVLARLRAGGMDDGWVSPHEGDVPAEDLRSELAAHGEILRWRGEESPLRFGLVRYFIHRRDRYGLLESSAALTALFNGLDRASGSGPGRLMPSLGFNEVTVVWQRQAAQ